MTLLPEKHIDVEFFKGKYERSEHHKWNSIHLHCVAEISDTEIPQTSDIYQKLDKYNLNYLHGYMRSGVIEKMCVFQSVNQNYEHCPIHPEHVNPAGKSTHMLM